MVTPDNIRIHGMPYALDNGAWGAFQRGRRLDTDAFMRAYEKHAECAVFTVLPDIVCGGRESLDLTLFWLDRLVDSPARKLIAVQNGFTPDEIGPLLSDRVGVFVGGDTEWKEATTILWGELARQRGAYCHVGRVNTVRRLKICSAAGCDSFDGSGVSRYSSELPRIDFWRRQFDLFGGVPASCSASTTATNSTRVEKRG